MADLNISGGTVELEGNASAETLSCHDDHLLTCDYFRRPREALFRAGDFDRGVGFVAINSYTDT